MVNGGVARTLYMGAYVLLALCIVGMLVLAGINEEAPEDLKPIVAGLVAFIAGAHVAPPNIAKVGAEPPDVTQTAGYVDTAKNEVYIDVAKRHD